MLFSFSYVLFCIIFISFIKFSITLNIKIEIKNGPILFSIEDSTNSLFGSTNFSCSYRKLVIADPKLACGQIKSSVNYLGSYVLVWRGLCSFHSKAINMAHMGALGVIFINNEDNSFVASYDPSLKNKNQQEEEKKCKQNKLYNKIDKNVNCELQHQMDIVAVMVSRTTSENILQEIKLITHTNDISRNLHARIAPDKYCTSGGKETIILQNTLITNDEDLKIKNSNENEKTNMNLKDKINNINNENSANIPSNLNTPLPSIPSKLVENKIKSDLQDLCNTLTDPKLDARVRQRLLKNSKKTFSQLFNNCKTDNEFIELICNNEKNSQINELNKDEL